MTTTVTEPGQSWPDAVLAAAVLAVDPAGLGIRLRAPACPAREAWIAMLGLLLPAGQPMRRCPAAIADDRLLGGIDLAATLATGTRVAHRGLLAETDGGVLVLPMAERASAELAARLCAVLDTGEVALERDGLGLLLPARLGVVALDEGCDDEAPPAAALLDRLALTLVLEDVLPDVMPPEAVGAVLRARDGVAAVEAGDAVLEAMCRTAQMAGIGSVRAPLLALRVARVVAALQGRAAVSDADAAVAARLVLAPRATRLPEAMPDERPGEAPEQAPPGMDDPGEREAEHAAGERMPEPAPHADAAGGAGDDEDERAGDMADLVLEAVRAALPADLLVRLEGAAQARSNGAAGRVEVRQRARQAALRGRPVGVRPGDPSRGRLDVLATLRAALPWQTIRRLEASRQPEAAAPRVRVRREDFRITRFAPRLRNTTLFVVDASGSSARSRLAEAKGCVELLLAECYVRRDQVALVAFRGRGAELVLPPTGSVARARRALDGLPGGGGTPLAAGLDAALAVADPLRRGGDAVTLVLLTDGRANVSRDGIADRAGAERDARESAVRVRLAGMASLLIDISPRANERAAELAGCMGGRYLLLPHADAGALTRAVRAAMPAA